MFPRSAASLNNAMPRSRVRLKASSSRLSVSCTSAFRARASGNTSPIVAATTSTSL